MSRVKLGTPKRNEARPTGKNAKPGRFQTAQEYYASRNGPVVVIKGKSTD